jgi:hypothetical protein
MSDDHLPIDFNHPAIRDYMSLIRSARVHQGTISISPYPSCSHNGHSLQVLTPLSLLVNIVTVAICAFVVHPSLGAWVCPTK